MSSTIREGPAEQARESRILKDEQDVDEELSSGKSFQENRRTSDSYSSLISVVGLFRSKSARIHAAVHSCLLIFADSSCTNSRWVYIEERKKVIPRGSTKAGTPEF